MLRFSFMQVQSYAHSAALHLTKMQAASGYRFRLFDDSAKTYLDDDSLFETTSLAEVVAFIRGYRKAIAKALRHIKAEPPTKPSSLNRKRQVVDKIKSANA